MMRAAAAAWTSPAQTRSSLSYGTPGCARWCTACAHSACPWGLLPLALRRSAVLALGAHRHWRLRRRWSRLVHSRCGRVRGLVLPPAVAHFQRLCASALPPCSIEPPCTLPTQAASSGSASAIPAAERIPCDVLAWGSAQRAPPVPSSLRSGAGAQENCWQHRSLPGLAPANTQLDVYTAAVGRKHAAVITATGAVYTWGEGRSGKLGLGHDQVGDWSGPAGLKCRRLSFR